MFRGKAVFSFLESAVCFFKPSPLGGRWHGEAVTDEGAIIERFRLSQGVSPPAGGQRPPLRANRNISERAGEDTRPYEKRESSGFAVGADNLGGPRAHTVRPYGMAWAARPGGRALRASWFTEGGRPHGAAPTAETHRERWLGKGRRGCEAATATIFAGPGPSGPAVRRI